jgi:hypothetical protein
MPMKRAMLLGLLLLLAVPPSAPGQPSKDAPEEHNKALAEARKKGLEWLTKNQAANGSWGKQYTVASTSFACLSYLAHEDEAFDGDHGKALLKGLKYLTSMQTDGTFQPQGHSWIHGQGFATLALAEAYGRSLTCKFKPDIDTKKIKEIVVKAVKVIEKSQSNSGGWWYTQGSPGQHEGSTTVCAVQALVSANNFGMEIDDKVLDKGFAYLKKCQTKEGGFNYQLGDGTNMKEGTAAAVATLGLMQKFDFKVMVDGYKFLLKVTPQTISNERFPYYGHFYGCMGMRLLGLEYKDNEEYRTKTTEYILGAQKEVLSWQGKDGSFPVKAWMLNNENAGFATAFAMLTLGVTEGRLSILNRDPPKLPEEK